jgi:photosystem II stability/assembly factor-like uncharacterized protein
MKSMAEVAVSLTQCCVRQAFVRVWGIVGVMLAITVHPASAQNFWQHVTSNRFVAPAGAYNGTLYGHNGQAIFRSTDNGVSWDSLFTIAPSQVQNMTVGPTGVILIATSSAGMFRSTNGGSTWTPINSGLTTTGVMRFPLITPSGDFFVGTNNAGVFRSTNGGDSWTGISTGLASLNIAALCYDSSGNLFASTAGTGAYAIYKSTDNGGSWRVTSMPTNYNVSSLSVSPSGNIFAGTRGTGANGIYRSTDNGTTWAHTGAAGLSVFNSPFACLQGGISFVAMDTAGIYRSTNDGETWESVNSGLTSPAVLSPRYFGVIYHNGYLFTSTYDGIFRSSQPITTVSDKMGGDIPGRFSLEQNYPNPFNSMTKIQFSISNTQFTILKVFNLLGQEVATLINEHLEPGVYERTFDAGHLPSGVYLYRLSAGSFLQTKKLVLMR